MRALLYHRVSAADHGQSVDAGLERLRRHAEGRGWAIAGELTDAAPRHDTVRPGYRDLCESMVAGTGPLVLVVQSLHRLFPSARSAMLDLSAWLAARRHLVSIDDLVDTTRPEDERAWVAVLEVLGRFERQRHSEATTIGLLAAQLRRHGRTLGKGRPTVAVDLLELQTLWAEGRSYRQIHRELNRAGGGPSYGTVAKRLKLLDADGRLDHEARAAAIAKRKGRQR